MQAPKKNSFQKIFLFCQEISLDSLNIQSSGKRKKGFHRKSIPDSLKRPYLHAQTGFCFPIENEGIEKALRTASFWKRGTHDSSLQHITGMR